MASGWRARAAAALPIDDRTRAYTSVEARARVLPWVECPNALASAERLIGTPIGDVPEPVNDLPGGAGRLVQRSTGYVETIVAGQTIVARGELTDARPGSLVRGGAVPG